MPTLDGCSKKTKEFMTRYLIAYSRNDGFIGPTNKEMDVTGATIQRWRREDADFDAALREIFDNSLDVLEKEAYKRAHQGEEEDIYYQGQVVGQRKNKSDALLMWYINNKRGYANKSEHRVGGLPGAPPINKIDFYPDNLSLEEQQTLSALLEKAQAKPEKIPLEAPKPLSIEG